LPALKPKSSFASRLFHGTETIEVASEVTDGVVMTDEEAEDMVEDETIDDMTIDEAVTIDEEVDEIVTDDSFGRLPEMTLKESGLTLVHFNIWKVER